MRKKRAAMRVLDCTTEAKCPGQRVDGDVWTGIWRPGRNTCLQMSNLGGTTTAEIYTINSARGVTFGKTSSLSRSIVIFHVVALSHFLPHLHLHPVSQKQLQSPHVASALEDNR